MEFPLAFSPNYPGRSIGTGDADFDFSCAAKPNPTTSSAPFPLAVNRFIWRHLNTGQKRVSSIILKTKILIRWETKPFFGV
jgi:hypothetical protein